MDFEMVWLRAQISCIAFERGWVTSWRGLFFHHDSYDVEEKKTLLKLCKTFFLFKHLPLSKLILFGMAPVLLIKVDFFTLGWLELVLLLWLEVTSISPSVIEAGFTEASFVAPPEPLSPAELSVLEATKERKYKSFANHSSETLNEWKPHKKDHLNED